MKRFLCLTLIASVLLGGCFRQVPQNNESVTFYYLRSQYQYGNSQSIMGQEERQASGHREDLRYLMVLYLMGPTDEDLRSPLPAGTRVLSVEQEEGSVTVTLSEVPASMTDVAFSLTCACLTKTCMGLTGAESVTIISGSRIVTMGLTNLILTDSGEPTETEETQ